MGPSSIRDAIFFGAPFKPLARALMVLIGTSFAALCVVFSIRLGFKSPTPLEYGLWVSAGLTFGLLTCVATGHMQSSHAIRVFWTGIEINRCWLKDWYDWSDVVEISSTGLIRTKTNRIFLNAGVFKPQYTTQLRDELLRRFEAYEASEKLTFLNVQPTHTGEVTTVRPWRTEDWPAYRRIFSEPSIRSAHAFDHASMSKLRKWFKSAVRTDGPRTIMAWHFVIADERKDGSVCLGHLDAWLTDPTLGTVEIAYGILPNARRCGHGRRAIQWLLDTLSQFEGIRSCEAQVRSDNVASITLLTSIGFRQTDKRSSNGSTESVCRLIFSIR